LDYEEEMFERRKTPSLFLETILAVNTIMQVSLKILTDAGDQKLK